MDLLEAMLAITGIFGMAAYSVSKQMRELGIRVALAIMRQPFECLTPILIQLFRHSNS